MIATNLEQSKRLLELGLDPATADMTYLLFSDGRYDLVVQWRERPKGESFLPAWSLSALLEVMPKRFDTNCLKIEQGLLSDKWFCQYWGGEFFANEEPVTAAYEMVCWLLENGYIKKGEEE